MYFNATLLSATILGIAAHATKYLAEQLYGAAVDHFEVADAQTL